MMEFKSIAACVLLFVHICGIAASPYRRYHSVAEDYIKPVREDYIPFEPATDNADYFVSKNGANSEESINLSNEDVPTNSDDPTAFVGNTLSDMKYSHKEHGRVVERNCSRTGKKKKLHCLERRCSLHRGKWRCSERKCTEKQGKVPCVKVKKESKEMAEFRGKLLRGMKNMGKFQGKLLHEMKNIGKLSKTLQLFKLPTEYSHFLKTFPLFKFPKENSLFPKTSPLFKFPKEHFQKKYSHKEEQGVVSERRCSRTGKQGKLQCLVRRCLLNRGKWRCSERKCTGKPGKMQCVKVKQESKEMKKFRSKVREMNNKEKFPKTLLLL